MASMNYIILGNWATGHLGDLSAKSFNPKPKYAITRGVFYFRKVGWKYFLNSDLGITDLKVVRVDF
jgi:hypothetical protein